MASVAPFVTVIPVFAQQGKPPAPNGVRWEDDSIRFGDSVRIEPKIRVQADILLWNSQEPIDDRFDWGSRRIGVNGELFDRVQFQVERALQDDDDDDTAWRDVYANVRINRALQVRGGRFKLPFSMERNTSRDELDFLQRAAAVRAISPTRDTGVMVHGRVANRVVEYEVGVFQHADGLEVVPTTRTHGALWARRSPDASSSHRSGTTTTARPAICSSAPRWSATRFRRDRTASSDAASTANGSSIGST